jgi:hypothetical protein
MKTIKIKLAKWLLEKLATHFRFISEALYHAAWVIENPNGSIIRIDNRLSDEQVRNIQDYVAGRKHVKRYAAKRIKS